jgi:hypothetical protein
MVTRRSRPQLGLGSRLRVGVALLFATAAALVLAGPASAAVAPRGELDCNGQSPVQQSVKMSFACTDIRGFNNVDNQFTWGGRFYDNGEYIGHDEPDMTFLSNKAGSGNNVTWTETLPRDPSAAPTVANPGSDITHWFELSVAPWYSMAMCDPNSYPQTPCTAESDTNAPESSGKGGGGAAFMEMQFYPPGFAPFADSISCDNTHWCSALTIDSLECKEGFADCNTSCEEPVNFGFIQTNGVPTGPPSPQDANLDTETPNSHTLLLNPGDHIKVHMFDASVPGGGGAHAFEVVVTDLTTGQSGFMQASAQNGFQNTSIKDCSGTPHNFEPEYNTAAKSNIIPWAALQTNISTQYETGHWEACTSLDKAGTFTFSNGLSDTYYNECKGPYESAKDDGTPEVSDAFCYPAGDTHGALNAAPDTVTGCIDDLFQNGDLDFDGQPYYADWPLGSSPTDKYPGSFVENLPSSDGGQYSQFFIQTDLALSESTCSSTSDKGCSVPPPGPGDFYPYWTRLTNDSGCFLEFGNVHSGTGVNDYGQDAQYGHDLISTLGYSEYEGPLMDNSCSKNAGGT